MTDTNYLLRLWTGPLPHQELFPDRQINPLLHWFIHPLKRRIAKYYLLFLQRISGLKVIAVTGSAGKTITKNMLTSVFSLEGPTVSTLDNITSTYNLPTTILRCSMRTRYLILEMSIEYPGDMDFYTWLARPDGAVYLNANRTHTQYLKDVSVVASEKAKLIDALVPSAPAVINADDPNINLPVSGSVFKFGASPNCFTQIKSSVISSDLKTKVELVINQKSFTIHLPFLGRHFAYPAAAAATIAILFNVHPQNIVYGLEHSPVPSRRLYLIPVKNGPLLLDDTHNANPLAVAASLDTLIEISRLTGNTPVFVFGQMNELGQYEQSAHEEVGLKIRKLKIENLLCTGPATKYTIAAAGTGQYFDTVETLSQRVIDFSSRNSHLCILIKASRSFHFETIVESLTQNASIS
ncbi:MAG: UDP-N-acetylmuramoyl-tripeptide-D-alanyl-D-alanine ligase [Candidatus Amesbacteria bacterium GW2011_GWB1_47_19]|nr:MAG: UDP-N-acetylmuramoyl-tripeptide-D-alanyl-D-alanine ligase [Candidatus Amesbacteria bacterium GW2011_GWA1_44_24]KKU31931.1 MAG: UDP-N-acetylmuramoyl-tripeptide-D-alanyl-D-alanine ligase [Candidatus Amesbacteria bacterium GW2011_GWC1_46_24]KKU66867.1 MAG: UDP-N-acetylmuramoyl-tripeptide-D-alanyl-D-alanine ligase [Candidatus Amesbacteria bacterium GW2011_GWB1_47_19]OGD05631.1 MAG: hypothetical protein A2379_00375 [Candidatus Amesbacteria bacterium RIFOXYB1_FULL_47_13]